MVFLITRRMRYPQRGKYAGYAENSINPRVSQTYLFVRHTTLPALAATLELSEF